MEQILDLGFTCKPQGEGKSNFDRDVLGAYYPHERQALLYVGPIALASRVLGISVGSLTIVVLAHELAHAYTHIGVDIDGYEWDTAGFVSSPVDLLEGLAQYYTAMVLPKLSYREEFLHAVDAYERLLCFQPEPYKVHLKWLSNFSSEEVRAALLKVRRTSRLGALCDEAYKVFEDGLEDAKKYYRGYRS